MKRNSPVILFATMPYEPLIIRRICSSPMRETMQIKGALSDRRLFARMFDKAFKDFPTMDAFIKLMNLDGGHHHDQEKSYQNKFASLISFGNTSKHEENSIMYMGSGWNAGFEDSILKCIFYNLGFKKKKDLVDERIKKYKNLYRKYEALWRRGNNTASFPLA